MNSQAFEIRGQKLRLLPEYCAFWEEENILLLADIHIGKAEHFRNSGIPIPVAVAEKNIQVLENVFEQTKPTRILILGDLFHAWYNSEWKIFQEFLWRHNSISFELIPGNHDILNKEIYVQSNIIIHPLKFFIPPFVFSHKHISEEQGYYNISGHVHPAILLKGNGGQRMRLPCYHFGKNKGLLPAFGVFTGMHIIQPESEDNVFIIGNGRVIRI